MKNYLSTCICAALAAAPMFASAGISIVDNEKGNFSIGGNVEINFNYQDKESSENEEFNQDGRVLVEFAGQKYTPSGHFVGVKAQPLFQSTGELAVDDAYFEFGKKDAWAIKMGRYEAYDMFPVGLDVFLEYSGDTANDLYNDGAAYTYQMKEARGRGSDGQIMYYQSFGNLYVELGTMLGDRSNLFGENDLAQQSYHGKEIVETKDSFLVRPVVAYQVDNFKIAASMETNLVSDAAVTLDGTDVSDRTGYGLSTNWSNDSLSINANVAYMDAVDETNLSAGLNAVWNNFGLGYVYAHNTYDDASWAEGDVDVNTVYASYAFADVLEIQDFSILLGTYYTTVSTDLDTQIAGADFSEDDDFGARVRFFYSF